MEVILKQDISGLGKANTVVKVKDGFARNFLIPNKLALLLTEANLKKIETEKQNSAVQAERAKRNAQALKEKLDNFSLTIPVLAQDDEKLYGSVTAQDLARSLKEENFDIAEGCLVLDEPIKSLGIYEVALALHPEVSAKIKVWVVRK